MGRAKGADWDKYGKPDDDTPQEKIKVLDQEDIALLKSYVSFLNVHSA